MPRKPRLPAAERIRARASMRPGLLCPGSFAADLAGRARAFRFNEAGAVMPRKAMHT